MIVGFVKLFLKLWNVILTDLLIITFALMVIVPLVCGLFYALIVRLFGN